MLTKAINCTSVTKLLLLENNVWATAEIQHRNPAGFLFVFCCHFTFSWFFVFLFFSCHFSWVSCLPFFWTLPGWSWHLHSEMAKGWIKLWRRQKNRYDLVTGFEDSPRLFRVNILWHLFNWSWFLSALGHTHRYCILDFVEFAKYKFLERISLMMFHCFLFLLGVKTGSLLGLKYFRSTI